MLTIEPTGAVLGATVRGVDLAQSLDERDMGRILLALGRHGVLRFPDQHLDLASLKRFSEFFGEIQGNPIRDADPMREYPEIGILSNLTEDGKYIGSPDAGQDWHTDMTYREVPGFVILRHSHSAPGWQATRRNRVLEHAPRLRRPALRDQKPAGANDRDP